MVNPFVDIYKGTMSIKDFDRAEEEFQARKRAAALEEQMAQQKLQAFDSGRDLPAAIQLANEIEKARVSGNRQRYDTLFQAAKLLDRGVLPSWDGADQSFPPAMPQQPAQSAANSGNPIDVAVNEAAQSGAQPVIKKVPNNAGYSARTMPGYDQVLGNRAATTKGMATQAQKNVELLMNPQIANAESRAKYQGDQQNLLGEMESTMPMLMDTVNKLSNLGKTATYTLGGQAIDYGRRQLNMNPRESAVARTDYMATVANQVLPLLRQTFGAQFTAAEGDKLLSTLGDPDKTPQEKDAALRSFIIQKQQHIQSLQRQTGSPITDFSGQDPLGGAINDYVNVPQAPTKQIKKKSFDVESAIFNAKKAGYSEEEIKQYLQSKGVQ